MKHLSFFNIFLMAHVVFMTFLICDAIFRWSGHAYYLTFIEFLPDLAMMILIFTVLAALVTVALKVLEFLARTITKRLNKSIDFGMLYGWCFLVIFSIVIIKYFKLWIDSFISVPYWNIFRFVILVVILIYASALTWKLRERLIISATERFKPVFWLFFLISLCSILVVAQHALHTKGPDFPVPVVVSKVDSSRPNIILVTFDALSARNMSVYGYERKTTPFLEELVRESHLFTRFYANANFTTPSVISMLTSRYPWSHQTYHHKGKINEAIRSENFVRILRENGYSTMAFVVNRVANPYQLGIARDFDILVPEYKLWTPYKVSTSIGLMVSRVLDHRFDITWWWLNFYINEIFSGEENSRSEFPAHIAFNLFLERMPSVRQPFFVWIHLLPPHTPYLPPKPHRDYFASEAEMSTELSMRGHWGPYTPSKQDAIDSLRKRYDEYILYIDAEFREFVGRLKKAGLYDKSLLIFSSDHGEIFEKRFFGHGGPYLYEPLIHIPLIIHEPRQRKGTELDNLADLIDLSPTLLSYLGLSIPEWMDGESFLPALQNGAPSSRPIFSMWLEKNRSLNYKITTGTVAVLENDYKLIYYIKDGRTELYNLALDPGEVNNLVKKEPEIAERLKSMVMRRIRGINATRNGHP